MDLIYRLASAIARQEGYFTPGSKPALLNNPGDLRNAPWLTHPLILGGYWSPGSIQQGQAGLYHLIALRIAEGCSLRKLVNVWAPASDGNDPSVYLKNVMQWTGITDADAPLWNLLPPLQNPSLSTES